MDSTYKIILVFYLAPHFQNILKFELRFGFFF